MISCAGQTILDSLLLDTEVRRDLREASTAFDVPAIHFALLIGRRGEVG